MPDDKYGVREREALVNFKLPIVK